MEKEREEVEIDFLELGRKLWDNKKFIIKCSAIGAIVGLVIAFSIPKEYTTAVIFTTTSKNSQMSSMGALASLAGVNINTQSPDIFSPDLYPNILNSTSFTQGLLNINVKDPKLEINTTLYNYLQNEQKVTWWNYLLQAPRLLFSLFDETKNNTKVESNNNSQYSISKEDMDVINSLINSYNISTDKKTGITTFEVTSQSPTIAAFLVDTITLYLQSYIIQERTKKAQTDLENSRKLYYQYKENYNTAQQKLASFVDRNKNIISESYRFNQKKLTDEAGLAYTVYNQMAQQVQMDEIKVQNETPVFTIIQPAIEPLYPTAPKKKMIVIVLVFLTVLGSACWILRKDLKNIIF